MWGAVGMGDEGKPSHKWDIVGKPIRIIGRDTVHI